MRTMVRLAGVVLALSVVGCEADTGADDEAGTTTDAASAEEEVRAADERMLAAARARDSVAFAGMFAEDGVLMFANEPALEGASTIRERVARDFGMQDFQVSWNANDFLVAESGDLAVERGSYEMSFTTPQGRVQDRGKFLTVWRKIDGEWKVAGDMISSDLPMPGSEAPAQ